MDWMNILGEIGKGIATEGIKRALETPEQRRIREEEERRRCEKERRRRDEEERRRREQVDGFLALFIFVFVIILVIVYMSLHGGNNDTTFAEFLRHLGF